MALSAIVTFLAASFYYDMNPYQDWISDIGNSRADLVRLIGPGLSNLSSRWNQGQIGWQGAAAPCKPHALGPLPSIYSYDSRQTNCLICRLLGFGRGCTKTYSTPVPHWGVYGESISEMHIKVYCAIFVLCKNIYDHINIKTMSVFIALYHLCPHRRRTTCLYFLFVLYLHWLIICYKNRTL